MYRRVRLSFKLTHSLGILFSAYYLSFTILPKGIYNEDIYESKVTSSLKTDGCTIDGSTVFDGLVFIFVLEWLIIIFNPAIRFSTLLLERRGIDFE